MRKRAPKGTFTRQQVPAAAEPTGYQSSAADQFGKVQHQVRSTTQARVSTVRPHPGPAGSTGHSAATDPRPGPQDPHETSNLGEPTAAGHLQDRRGMGRRCGKTRKPTRASPSRSVWPGITRTDARGGSERETQERNLSCRRKQLRSPTGDECLKNGSPEIRTQDQSVKSQSRPLDNTFSHKIESQEVQERYK